MTGDDKRAYVRSHGVIPPKKLERLTTDCIICDIVAGTAEASFVHEDEVVSAFLDIRPATPGHLLVVPNDHFPLARELPDAVASRAFSVAQRLARALIESELRADGTNIMLADGEAAGMDVPHAHLHVIPRFLDDGFFVVDAAAWHRPPPTRQELDEQAAAIRRVQTQQSEVK